MLDGRDSREVPKFFLQQRDNLRARFGGQGVPGARESGKCVLGITIHQLIENGVPSACLTTCRARAAFALSCSFACFSVFALFETVLAALDALAGDALTSVFGALAGVLAAELASGLRFIQSRWRQKSVPCVNEASEANYSTNTAFGAFIYNSGISNLGIRLEKRCSGASKHRAL